MRWLWRLWVLFRRDEPTLVEQYRKIWDQPVWIDGEERLPVARRLP